MSEIVKGGAKQKEDEYFAKMEFERKRKRLAEEHQKMKEKEREEAKELHWMHCPKCGMEMVELEFEGVKIDKCTSCFGIFLDDGELNEIMADKNTGLVKRFGKLFK